MGGWTDCSFSPLFTLSANKWQRSEMQIKIRGKPELREETNSALKEKVVNLFLLNKA